MWWRGQIVWPIFLVIGAGYGITGCGSDARIDTDCGSSGCDDDGDDDDTDTEDDTDSSNTGESEVTVVLSPTEGAADVLATSSVSVTFSGADADASSELITVPENWGTVLTLLKMGGDGTNRCTSDRVTFADNVVTCAPGGLAEGQYRITVSGVTDADGNTIAEATSTFSVVNVPGDFNGDGYADLLIGAEGANPGDSGRAYLYYGSGSGIDTTTRLTLSGEADSRFGRAVSSRGDFNGDGLSDLLIGAPNTASRGQDRVTLYYGAVSPSDSPDPDVTFTDGGGTDNYGGAITSGDFNGDGYDDVVIGGSETNAMAGRVTIYYGSADMDGVADLTMDGASERLGMSVASGDFDADGYDDLVAGGPGSAQARLYYGSPDGLSATAVMTLDGEVAVADGFGGASSSADFNGDGFADVLVSAGGGASGAGRVYIFYGAETGVDATADVTITGEAGSNLGQSASSGDFNGDGTADVLVSTRLAVGDNTMVSIYFGSASGMDGTADVTFSGEGNNHISVSSGDFNADGYSDAVIGIYTTDGRVKVFLGASDLTGTPGEDLSMAGASHEAFGIAVSGGASP